MATSDQEVVLLPILIQGVFTSFHTFCWHGTVAWRKLAKRNANHLQFPDPKCLCSAETFSCLASFFFCTSQSRGFLTSLSSPFSFYWTPLLRILISSDARAEEIKISTSKQISLQSVGCSQHIAHEARVKITRWNHFTCGFNSHVLPAFHNHGSVPGVVLTSGSWGCTWQVHVSAHHQQVQTQQPLTDISNFPWLTYGAAGIDKASPEPAVCAKVQGCVCQCWSWPLIFTFLVFPTF